MSAIFVKMPPAMRSAAAPSDSPIAKPMKQEPGVVARDEEQDAEHDEQLDADEQHADAHAGAQRNLHRSGTACPRRLANAVREFAKVLMRMPNHATP